MQFGILGPTLVRLTDGRDVAVRGARLRALLALLLVDAGRVVSAERLIDGLYGANPPSGVTNALQSQVSRLRQALSVAEAQGTLVEFHPAGYRLAVDSSDVDAHRFTLLAADGHRALAASQWARAATVLREALDLWRGPPLADVHDAPFARAEAARLEELRLAVTEDRIEAELWLGAYEPLIGELRVLVAAHPLRERLHGQLMRALNGSGRRAEALAAFEAARRTLAEELGTDPSPDLAAVHIAVLRGDTALAPATARPRLPAQLTSFVGREEELRRLGKLLELARLVTLHGPGGAGKTRLAIEAAGRLADDVYMVELAPLTDGGDLPQAVLHALGLRDAGLRAPADRGRDATDRLVAALADSELLLLLDSCEHLVADAARLASRLLGACPRVRIVATSREPLGLTGEALAPVSGLELPPEGTTARAAREFAAVRLFTDRAADVAPDFTVTPATIEAIQQICRTLDGLPLAIELAAARLHTLGVTEIAARLGDRFALLSRGSRTAEPRHQTLHAVVEWSWDLLDDAERTLARRLTVFAGGATLEAVERVCGMPTRAVVDLLSSLVDKSLVEVSDGRYRMLDTVRAFCTERLADAAEAERLRLAHAAYFLDLAQTADPHLRRAEQLEWLRRLDADRDNLLAALRRAQTEADTETAMRLIAALSFYWWLRGLRGEAATLAGDILARIPVDPPPELYEEFALCIVTASLGGFANVDPHGTVGSAESILRILGRPPRQPFLLFLTAMAGGPPPDWPDSLAAMPDEWRPLLGPDPWSHALSAFGLGSTWLLHGEVELAQRQLSVALDGFRAVGDRWGTLMVLAATAELAYWRGDLAGSIAPMDEALRLADELDSTIDLSDLLRIRGDGYVRAAELDRAQADYVRATEVALKAGAPEIVAAARAGLGEIARERGDLAEALRLNEVALAECPVGWFGAEATRFGILVALGRIAEATGDAAAASGWYRQALTDTVGARSLPALAQAVEGLVGIELTGGDAQRAARLLGAATVLLRGAGGTVDLTRIAASVKREAGDAAYESALARGAAMTRKHALEVISGRS